MLMRESAEQNHTNTPPNQLMSFVFMNQSFVVLAQLEVEREMMIMWARNHACKILEHNLLAAENLFLSALHSETLEKDVGGWGV